MSFREKSAWITLVAILLGTLLFFVHGPRILSLRPHWMTFYLMIASFVAFFVVKVVGQLALYFHNRKEARTPKDEREQLIDLKALRIGACVYVLGTFLAVLSLHHGAGGRAVGYFIVLALVIAEVVNQTARIVYHRRGF